MKITLKTKPLLTLVQALIKVIPARSAQPILENFLVSATSGGVSITASDLETTMTALLPKGGDEPASVEEEGTIAIPARFLLDIIKQVEDDTVTLTANDRSASIAWKTGRSSIPVFDPDDFPATSGEITDAKTFDIPEQELLDALNATLYAVGEDEIRPVMCGIFFDATPEGLCLVSSDSHRLAIRTIPSVTVPEAASFVLHKRNATLLKGLLGGEGDVKVSFNQDAATFLADGITLRARTVVGKYPRWRDVMPKGYQNVLTVDPKALASVVKRVSVCASKVSNLIKIVLGTDALGGSMEISAQDLGFSTSAVEKTPADYQGKNLTIGFKAPFMLELLGSFSCDNVKISFLDGKRAVLVEPEQLPEGSYTSCVLMPVATS